MKKTTFILLFVVGILFQIKAESPASVSKQFRDSIFQSINSETNDTLRSKILREAFQQYIGQETALEYLDSALALSKRKGMHEEELYTLFDYCRHYEYRGETPKMERHFLKLKEAAYQYKNYSLYYTIWLAILQIRCAQGDTEYAIMQAKEMQKEANRIKYKSGTFVSLIALAQAQDFAEQYDEAVANYKQALVVNPNANNYSLLLIHQNLGGIYLEQKKYTEALSELEQQQEVLNKMLKEDPQSINTLKSIFLETEISFGRVYAKTEDKNNLKLHLTKAEKFYDKESFFSYYIDYHALWGVYYKLIKDWNKCFHEFNLAISACRGAEPFHENSILKMKAEAMLEAGQYEEAAGIYKTAVLKGDSLNQDMLQRHEEVYQANYKIQKALLDKELMTKQYRWIYVGASAIILILMLLAIIRALRIHRQLRRSEEETRQALETIEAADKMKEYFLQNITYEIRIPLNTVVGFSELLSAENDLSEEEIQEYSVAIKNNSEKLLALINNILDLSRLEAGMMRFNVQEYDAIELCREVKMMVNMQTTMVNPHFHTELETLTIQADSRWFMKLLSSLLTVPRLYDGEICQVEYSLTREGQCLRITVKGSPLYQVWEDEQEQRILHDINRLYLEAFKGSYQVSEEEKVVTITYPLG
ncbi:tetratricopeptide repeat-containing sensor histidine kinase [Bacteroides stercorirosoris]|uniref:histidine kinase n=1 Tax=Bacteroides stercorirosoris TaxID=871324 RepID=A0A1M6A5X7_9BACE|nr:histidine kinase dimerization/phospho-acceptor domain-containing protein [Bacteroides stercorirosoris]SHI31878.1 His Kinase A (phospho-acceptor) domain-containing protein [Bacteroides stercorirosoris]